MNISNAQFLPATLIVNFYKLWHGSFNLKGAGYLLRLFANKATTLQSYPLILPKGQILRLDFRDVSASYWINHTLGDTFEEMGLFRAITQRLNANDVVWDIGANCGLFSYLLAVHGTFKKLYFFEPNKNVFDIAQAALQPWANIKGYNLALSDKNGKAILRVPCEGSTNATLEQKTDADFSVKEIETIRGDDLINNGMCEPPNVIKIDTEGHELSVIRGFSGVIERYQPSIYFENLSLADDAIFETKPVNYSLSTVSDQDGSLVTGLDRSVGHNCVYSANK